MDDSVMSDAARRSAVAHADARWKDLREWLASTPRSIRRRNSGR
jgi:hypothetical protein